MMLVRGNSLLSDEQPDDPVFIEGQEWLLTDVLGRGTFSTVYAASTVSSSEPSRAVKVTMVQLMGSTERAELTAEHELWSSVDHPNIIALYGSVLTEARYCLLLELAGEELFSAITRMDELAERDAARWSRQLLSGLDHLHARRIVHCDVKPENCLLVATSGEGGPVCKLSDFGCACRLDAALASAISRGSRGYAAPEQIFGARPGYAADLWGMGVLAYVLLSGTMPFKPASYGSACLEPVQFGGAAWASVSREAREFVASLLVLQPSKRPSAAVALEHGWLDSADSTALLTPVALRAHRAPVLTVPTCLLPVARERPLPTTSTTDPSPTPTERFSPSAGGDAAECHSRWEAALAPASSAQSSGFGRRASANDLCSLGVCNGSREGGKVNPFASGLVRRNQSVGSELASLVSSSLGVISPKRAMCATDARDEVLAAFHVLTPKKARNEPPEAQTPRKAPGSAARSGGEGCSGTGTPTAGGNVDMGGGPEEPFGSV